VFVKAIIVETKQSVSVNYALM